MDEVVNTGKQGLRQTNKTGKILLPLVREASLTWHQ